MSCPPNHAKNGLIVESSRNRKFATAPILSGWRKYTNRLSVSANRWQIDEVPSLDALSEISTEKFAKVWA